LPKVAAAVVAEPAAVQAAARAVPVPVPGRALA
jgi:hypothetical protein